MCSLDLGPIEFLLLVVEVGRHGNWVVSLLALSPELPIVRLVHAMSEILLRVEDVDLKDDDLALRNFGR